jgi:hypothetical protein
VAPFSGGLVSDLGYVPRAGDTVYTWDGQAYCVSSYLKNKAGTATNWSNGEPQIGIGQDFWLSTAPGAVWSNYFEAK